MDKRPEWYPYRGHWTARLRCWFTRHDVEELPALVFYWAQRPVEVCRRCHRIIRERKADA